MTDRNESKSKAAAGSTDHARNPVDELADDFVARLRRGEYPSVTEYTTRHPEFADEIREVLPTLAMLEKCGEDELANAAEEDLIDRARFGRFRLK